MGTCCLEKGAGGWVRAQGVVEDGDGVEGRQKEGEVHRANRLDWKEREDKPLYGVRMLTTKRIVRHNRQ